MADIQITADYTDIQTLNRELLGIQKYAKDSATVFQTQYAKVERQLNATARAGQTYYNDLLKIDTKTKSAATSAGVFEKALKREEIQLKAVLGSINPLYAATEAYNQKVTILSNSLESGSIDLLEYNKNMGLLQDQAIASGLALNTATGKISGFRSASNRTGVALQQTGYQVGDFLVQIQGGTNAFVAFGQQATQLVGVLPLVSESIGISASRAIALSAGLGIAIPLVTAIGAALMRTRKEADEASKGVKTLDDKIKSLTASLEEWTFAKKASSLGISSDELLGTTSLSKAEEALDKITLKLDNMRAAAKVGGGISLFGSQKLPDIFSGPSKSEKGSIDEFVEALQLVFDLRQRQYDKQKELLFALEEETSLMQMVAQFGEDSLEYKSSELQLEIDKINAQVKSGELHAEIAAKMIEQLQIQDDITTSMEFMSGINITNPFTDAIPQALNLRDIMYEMSTLTPSLMTTGTFLKNPDNPLFYGDLLPPTKKATKKRTSGGGGSSKEEEDYLETLKEELEYKRSLIGVSETEANRLEFIQTLKEKDVDLSDKRIETLYAEQIAIEAATAADEKRTKYLESFSNELDTMFESIITGTESVGDAFRGMLYDMVLDIYKSSVIEPMSSGLSSILGGFLGQADGGAWSGGVQMFANGGVVNAPTAFSHSGGLGVMGEAGPEAIMPLKRGADGKLGVATNGSNSQAQNVNVTYQIIGNGDEYIMGKIAQSAPNIVAAAENSILNSRKRGGKFKQVFK